MLIKVFSERTIKLFRTDKRYAIISIQDPLEPFIKLYRPKNCLGIAKFKFYDFDQETGQDNYDAFLFTQTEAKHLLNFYDLVKDEAEILCVHCVAGISRSAGVAAALSKIHYNNDEEFFKHYCPNSLVYRTILNTRFGGGYGKEEKEGNNKN